LSHQAGGKSEPPKEPITTRTAQVLRRSAATLRAYAGVPKHVAAKEMGHAPSVFERSYAKVYEDAQDMTRDANSPCVHRVRRATKLTNR